MKYVSTSGAVSKTSFVDWLPLTLKLSSQSAREQLIKRKKSTKNLLTELKKLRHQNVDFVCNFVNSNCGQFCMHREPRERANTLTKRFYAPRSFLFQRTVQPRLYWVTMNILLQFTVREQQHFVVYSVFCASIICCIQ